MIRFVGNEQAVLLADASLFVKRSSTNKPHCGLASFGGPFDFLKVHNFKKPPRRLAVMRRVQQSDIAWHAVSNDPRAPSAEVSGAIAL